MSLILLVVSLGVRKPLIPVLRRFKRLYQVHPALECRITYMLVSKARTQSGRLVIEDLGFGALKGGRGKCHRKDDIYVVFPCNIVWAGPFFGKHAFKYKLVRRYFRHLWCRKCMCTGSVCTENDAGPWHPAYRLSKSALGWQRRRKRLMFSISSMKIPISSNGSSALKRSSDYI